MALAIQTLGVRKEYAGGAGLHGVDLEVPEGSTYGLIGPNGAGKTTLLNLLVGLRRPDAGEVRFSVPSRRVAVCPDVPEFEPWLRAREVLNLAVTLAPGAEETADVDRVLEEMGLAGVAARRVGDFSRGMTQRLSLAATLVVDPAIVILDEPTSAIDPIGRHELLDLIAHLGRDRTVLFSSHILADVQRVCETVGVLIDGRLRCQGPMSRLLEHHVQPSWKVRVRGDARAVLRILEDQDWVQAARLDGEGHVRIDAVTMRAGEECLVRALAAAGQPVVAVEPTFDDLEGAFLRLTGFGESKPGPP
jgi:ABC-2 type transport system ATP-binding protein